MEEKQLSSLDNKVEKDNELKDFIVSYVGQAKKPEDDQVTLEMVVDVLAEQFPELVLCMSEENWVRGYQQALTDVEEGERYLRENNAEQHNE